MKKIIFSIIQLLIYLIPKNKNKIVFRSFPDFSGNSNVLYEYIIKNHSHYNCIWLTDNENNKGCYVKSIKGIYHYATAKHVVTTHNDYISISPKNQNYISLWHGMPLKKIGYLGDEYEWMKSVSSNRIATSDLTRSLIASSFDEKANNVYITGQPVCDNLFSKNKLLENFNVPESVKKIACYLPTFREDFNEEKIEGKKVTASNIFRIENFNHKDFLKYLKSNEIFLFVKLHPAEQHVIESIETNEYIHFISSNEVELYSLLSNTDFLITDYSSVYIDYLLTNNPISFVIPDEEQYIKSRNGFTVEPYEFWAPGEKVKNNSELYEMLDNFKNDIDLYKEQRMLVKDIFHKYQNANSCKRVFDNLIKK